MIARRRFLAGLLGAPALLQGAAQQAINQTAVGAVSMAGEPTPDPSWKADYEVASHLRRMLEKTRPEVLHGRLPAYISEKKSWSTVYQEHVFRKEYFRHADLSNEIDDALHNKEGVERAVALARIAAKMRNAQ